MDKIQVGAVLVALVVDIYTVAKEKKADTEIVEINIAETAIVAMVEVAASSIRVLNFPLFQKAKIH